MDPFGGAPRFLAYPRPVVVQSGTDATLRCQIGGDPQPLVVWERNNEEVVPGSRHNLFDDGRIYGLTISAVTVEDSGQYICKARNCVGETYVAATLKVEGKARNSVDETHVKDTLKEEGKARNCVGETHVADTLKEEGKARNSVDETHVKDTLKVEGKARNSVGETHVKDTLKEEGKARNSVGETHVKDTLKVEGKARNCVGETHVADALKEEGKARNSVGETHVADTLKEEGKARNSVDETHVADTLKEEGKAPERQPCEDNRPRFLIKPLSARVGRGEDVLFSCKLWGEPQPEVTWEKDGKSLGEIFESSHFSLGCQDGGWVQLQIFKVRVPDAGVYTCRATNGSDEALAGAVLLVDSVPAYEEEGTQNGYANGHQRSYQEKHRGGHHYTTRPMEDPLPNSTKVKKFAVTEGKHAKFRCFVTGKPKPDIVWRKDGMPITAGRRHLLYEDREGYFTLKVLYCKQQDNGVYVCAASNMAGQTLSAVHLTVKEPSVRFKKSLRDLEVYERGLAVLECEVPDDSLPTTWYLEDRQLKPGEKYGMEERGTKRRLTIRDIGVDDDGIYLCEMPDGARSVAEVAVKGKIVRKLPRKVDVLEGENAAFCVEVEEDEMDIHWYKDGIVLRETHQTIIKSFGKTHVLVFVNTAAQDSGIVTFTVGRSKTSSKLRVKAARHSPPSCPVGVQLNPGGVNAALLSWTPAHNSHKNPPLGYVLERQEVGSQEWLPCLTTDSNVSVEILGDSVPHEADYHFRICSVNKYGRSSHVEFPGVVHLVPETKVKAALKDVRVRKGQEAVFSIELSGSVAGTWYLNGTQLQENERFSIRWSRTQHSLHIRGVQEKDNGAEITFTARGIKDSAELYIQAPAKFTPLLEMDRAKLVEVGNPVVLYCELSDPAVPVHWYREGEELLATDGLHIQSEGNMRRIVIESAEFSHSGLYRCDAGDDVIQFKVEVEAPSRRLIELPEVERNQSIGAGCPVILQCELLDPRDQVCWYKDGIELLPQTGLDFQSEGAVRRLVIQEAELCHTGVYSCRVGDDVIVFKVDVQAPPVTFAEVTEEDLYKSIEELDPLVLCCKVSRPGATVQWYKDGVEMEPNNDITMQADGTTRRLIIQSTQLSDAGIYTCCAGDSSLQFNVKMREPPVMIVDPKEDVHLNLYASEEIFLSCELSRSNCTVYWYKDGQKLQESESIKMLSEGPYRRLKFLHSALKDSGEYVCDTADDSAFFQLNISEAPVRIVSPSQSQIELHQQSSERMVLTCEISKSSAEVFWSRNGIQVEENDNLILEVDGAHRRLVIPETTVQDSAEYVCDTLGDSVTFFVNISEPPVRFVHTRKKNSPMESLAGDPVVLKCEVSRLNAEVSWKREGKVIEDTGNISITEDGLFRQLTINWPTPEDSGKYICDAKDDVMEFQVKITEPAVRILRKADIETEVHSLLSDDIVLECELSRVNGEARWYKNGEAIVENERLCFEEEGAFRSLVILSAELIDSGEYLCDATDDTITFHVTVQEPPVTIVGNSDSQEHQSLVAGDDLILACEVSRPDAAVTWHCNRRLLISDSRTCIESHGTVRKLIVSGLRPSDSGEYMCDAIDDRMVTMVKVQEPPVQFLNKEERNIVIGYESESVTLTAKVSAENAAVQWLKDWAVLAGERYQVSSEGDARFFTIDPLLRLDSGEYTCDANTDQMHFSLLVKEMRAKFVKPLENVLAHKNGLLTLRCELSRAKADVLWLKEGEEVVPSRRLAIRAEGPERTLTIHRLTAEDAGEYTCESKDDRTSATVIVEMPRVVEFIAELHNTTVLEGEDAALKCVVSPEDVHLVWYQDGQPIVPDDRMSVTRNGLCHTLYIRDCKVTDSCKVTAEAEGLVSKARLQVQEAQVVFTKKMESVVSEEYGDATLEVEVSLASAEVQWMRQGVVIQPGPRFTLGQNGRKRSLTVRGLTISDRGTYRCETLHDRTQGKLNVEPRKITIRKGLSDVETSERETASFEVELSHTDVEGVWQKDGIRLKTNSHWRTSAKGRVHSLTLSRLTLEDSGTIAFSAESVRTSARLVVKEPQVTILKNLEDLCFPDGSAATFECELSRQNADVKWLKGGAQLTPGKNHRIYSMGRKRFLQILQCEISDAGTYTCDAGDAKTSCTLEVYVPEVEVVQDLEDLDIQEDQNAVFMCEVSQENVPGEWFKDGGKIRPSDTIKIRQEGTKHFLLMCKVKAEDSGEITFVAKQAESTAYLEVEELPVTIVKQLRDRTALEKHRVILECTVSNSRCSARWYQGNAEIQPSERFEISNEGCYHKLVIHQVSLEDEGTYSVQFGEYISTATLLVEAQSLLMVRVLEDREETAPREVCFECEVSVPVTKAPVWSLNEEILQPGPTVRIENLGTVHRLTLKKTSVDMNGLVKFTIGKAKSSAKLNIRSTEGV